MRTKLTYLAISAIFSMGLIADQKPGTVQERKTQVNPKDGQTYVWIPAGKFQMGCSKGDRNCRPDENPPHAVTISKGFWIGETEVTWLAWNKVKGVKIEDPKGADNPVLRVSQNQAKGYCEAIGGSLPTEAQWEYAARAGTTGATYGQTSKIGWSILDFGPDELTSTTLTTEQINRLYLDHAEHGGHVHPVKKLPPNAFGLYDMLGNAAEWVSDLYSTSYYSSSAGSTDPTGPRSGTLGTVRGGLADHLLKFLRVSTRWAVQPNGTSRFIGFRCAMPGP